MALPAGRYGVTKEQLRKIKRLPINTIGMITETKEGIAIIEDGAKASQLITAGRQFWHNGKLYSADVDIAKDTDIITSGEGKNATEMPNITDQLPGTDAEKANEVTIARVENGSNPSATINEGEQFYHTGILYTATQDIATTDTITPNTNCRVSDSVTGQITSLDAQKADNSVIGPVEDGTTASQAYAVGEHFIRNGKFCTVTQAISSGATLTENTNYTADDIADWLEVEEGVITSSDARFTIISGNVYKYGRLAHIMARFTVSEDIDSTSLLTVMHSPYPAIANQFIMCVEMPVPYSIYTDNIFIVNTSGNIRLNKIVAGEYYITGTYIC